MFKLKLYSNDYGYPDYGPITQIGSTLDVTPTIINERTGAIRVGLDWGTLNSVNYLSFEKGGFTSYAKIDEIVHISGNTVYDLHYSVDAFRTYRSKVNFGTQFVSRYPKVTLEFDPMLRGADGTVNDYEIEEHALWRDPQSRFLVVQLTRPNDDAMVSVTPLQPNPYVFYYLPYQMNEMDTNDSITSLMDTIKESARPSNIVSIYSIPYVNLTFSGIDLIPSPLPLLIDGNVVNVGNWFRVVGGDSSKMVTLHSEPILFNKDILKTKHSVSVLVPEAGIISIPDELLFKPGLKLRMDVDVFSGTSNYMLVYDGCEITGASVRGGSVAPIPIAYDPIQQQIASQRTAMGMSLLSDVGSLVVGGGMVMSGAGAGVGGAMIGKGALGVISTMGGMVDNANTHTNPPAYLGTALAPNFNGKYFIMTIKGRKDNAPLVNSEFGYPVNQLMALSIPGSGFVQTQGCHVSGSIPNWAKDDINRILDEGLRIK